MRRFAKNSWQLPVATGFRRKDLLGSNSNPSYIGEFGFAAGGPVRSMRCADADLIVALGASLCDVETGGYTRLDPRTSVERVIHIAMRPEDAGRVFPVALRASASPVSPPSLCARVAAAADRHALGQEDAHGA